MIKRIVLSAIVAGGFAFAGLCANPVTEKAAISLTAKTSAQKKTVKLYETKDDSKATVYQCYYKLTLSKGKAYTVWLSGSQATAGKIRIRNVYGMESIDWNTDAPLARFEDVDCGDEIRWLCDGKEWANDWADDWDEEWTDIVDDGWGDWGKTVTPNTWTYYILVEGEKGSTATLNYIQADKIPTGVSSKPLKIKPTNKSQTKTLSSGFMGEYYYIQVTVKDGLCYRFGTTGGTTGNDLTFDESYNLNLGELGAYGEWKKSHNQAISFVPNGDQTILMRIKSSKGYGATGKIRFFVEKQKSVTSHKPTALKLGKATSFKPGYLNKPGSGYFDMIVDEKLFSVALSKGKNYVIETTGASASAPLIAYLYDSKGKVVALNESKGGGSADVRIAFTAPKSATYYVGVCENHGLLEEFTPKYQKISVTATKVSTISKSVKLNPMPGWKGEDPVKVDAAGTSKLTFGAKCWYVDCTLYAAEGASYAIAAAYADGAMSESGKLTYTVYSSKVSEKTLLGSGSKKVGQSYAFKVVEAGKYIVRVAPEAGAGCDFAPVTLHSIGYFPDGTACGAIKVTLTGASGKWKVGKSGSQNASGMTVISTTGTKTLYFTDVKGYATPASVTAKVSARKVTEVGDIYYGDKWDPKDDSKKKATSWTVKSSNTKMTKHTLWKTDKYDYYTFYSKNGYHYTFKLSGQKDGDQVFTIKDSSGKVFADNATSVSRVLLPKSSKPYYLTVKHSTDTNVGGAYTLTGKYENLGTVKFSASTYTAKDSATSVTLYATRTASKGACRVKYSLSAGTAKAGVNYIKSSGYVGWKDGDKGKKKIVVNLIPKTLPIKGKDLKFTVKLTDASTSTDADDGLKKVVQAAFPSAKTYAKATVKIANSAKYKDAAAAYASVYKDKKAKTTKEDTSNLRTGTFYGIVCERGTALKTGAAEFGAVTLTVKAGSKSSSDTFSAKVKIAGKSYSFTAAKKGWDATLADGQLVKTLVSTSNGATHTLKVTVADGKSKNWVNSACKAELSMVVSGVTALYDGQVYRNNAGIQTYLDKAFKFDGYYTMSLLPRDVVASDRSVFAGGVAEGNGYLTLTVDNKGTVKVAGLLPDMSSVAVSATACALVKDAASETGYAMVIPVYQANSNTCFATELRLFMLKDKTHLDGKGYKTVVNSNGEAYWNCDTPEASEKGVQGWRMTLGLVGGWYDKLVNLQGYYNSLAQSFMAGADGEFPSELLSAGYKYVAYPTSVPVSLTGDKFAAAKRSLVADEDNPALYDFVESVNPCNVKVSFKRATGVSSGTSSVWISNGSSQKQISGFKHFGVLTIDRDTRSGVAAKLDGEVLISGGLSKPVAIEARTWMFSIPFEIYAD